MLNQLHDCVQTRINLAVTEEINSRAAQFYDVAFMAPCRLFY